MERSFSVASNYQRWGAIKDALPKAKAKAGLSPRGQGEGQHVLCQTQCLSKVV